MSTCFFTDLPGACCKPSDLHRIPSFMCQSDFLKTAGSVCRTEKSDFK